MTEHVDLPGEQSLTAAEREVIALRNRVRETTEVLDELRAAVRKVRAAQTQPGPWLVELSTRERKAWDEA